jgi:hypothetical protein
MAAVMQDGYALTTTSHVQFGNEMECEHGEVKGPRFCALCRRFNTTAKIDAMDQVATNANGLWWAAACRAVKEIASKQPTLTADDVLILVESWGYVTTDNRALGPVMNDAKAKGLIKATGQFEPSINKRKHQSPTRIWQSLILPNQMELI